MDNTIGIDEFLPIQYKKIGKVGDVIESQYGRGTTYTAKVLSINKIREFKLQFLSGYGGIVTFNFLSPGSINKIKIIKRANIMNKKMSVEEYRNIAQVGDEVETNIYNRGLRATQGGMSDNIKGKVVKIGNVCCYIATDTNKEYPVDFKPYDSAKGKGWVKVLNKKKEYTKKIVSTSKNKTEKLAIELKRLKTGFVIDFKIPKEVEDFYAELSGNEMQQSEKWITGENVGAEFYKLNEDIKAREQAIEDTVFSDFGGALVNNNMEINTAMLRVKGASRGVVISSKDFFKIKDMDMEFYIQKLGEFVKKMYETVLTEKTVKAVISFQL